MKHYYTLFYIVFLLAFAACEDGNDFGDGHKPGLEPKPIPHMVVSVKQVAAGNVHSLIVKTDGTLWACGENGYGQLGDGTTIERLKPINIM